MPAIKLDSNPLEFQLPGDDKTYAVADPLHFMLTLTQAGLLDATGNIANTAEALGGVLARTKEAFGFPSLTYAQLMQVLQAINAYMEEVQKKTSLTPTLPPPTGSSPKGKPA